MGMTALLKTQASFVDRPQPGLGAPRSPRLGLLHLRISDSRSGPAAGIHRAIVTRIRTTSALLGRRRLQGLACFLPLILTRGSLYSTLGHQSGGAQGTMILPCRPGKNVSARCDTHAPSVIFHRCTRGSPILLGRCAGSKRPSSHAGLDAPRTSMASSASRRSQAIRRHRSFAASRGRRPGPTNRYGQPRLRRRRDLGRPP